MKIDINVGSFSKGTAYCRKQLALGAARKEREPDKKDVSCEPPIQSPRGIRSSALDMCVLI